MRLTSAALLVSTSILLTGCPGGGGGGDDGGGDGGGSGGGAGGGGGSGTPTGTTTFAGGSLASLQALSSGLSFDTLVITGTLQLPISTSTTIRANNLRIASTGRITYTHTDCQYLPAPNLTLTVAQSAIVEGQINLDGRFGTRVSGSSTCHSCTGQAGGDLAITANAITVSGSISNDGGGGGSFTIAGIPGSSPCSSGSSGDLQLAAVASMDLSGAAVSNETGRNFDGDPGASGTALVRVQNGMLTMQDGSFSTTGALTLQASSTSIFGPITYGTLSESIGGVGDTTAPTVSVLAPAANATLQFNSSVNVQVQASDTGTGFREVRIQGLGHNQTYSASQFVSGTLTVPITVPDVASPATLTVTGKDNRGNTTTQTVTGLQVQVPAETEPNDSVAGAAQTLAKNSPLQGTIQNAHAGSTVASVSANVSGQKKVEDFYKVVCCDVITDSDGFFILGRRLTIALDFSADAALRPDIDVYLLNSAGALVASSVKDNVGQNSYTETISATNFTAAQQGQTFYVAVQAWNVPSTTRYRIERQ